MSNPIILTTLLWFNIGYAIDVTNFKEGNVSLHFKNIQPTHPCNRPCLKNTSPMACRYHFDVEWYQTMAKACHACPHNVDDCYRTDCIPGDGSYRNVLVINRMLPGPKIEVCYGDEIIVDVQNNLLDSTTTVHWHGHPQKGSPYMDGVPFITQCPIQPGTTFRYQFPVNIKGTHIWHSHSGMQRTDGAFGALIVRTPDEMNPHISLYDYDNHVMLITDWMEHTGMQKFIHHYHSIGDNKPTSILINGKGRYLRFAGKYGEDLYTPVERFIVKKGFRYRFRLINVSFMNCPLEMSVDGHNITLISTDGHDIEPVEAESLVSYAGERFDFIINADQEDGLYWIRYRGLMDCDERFTSAFQTAVLQYGESSYYDFPKEEANYKNSLREGLQINALNKGVEDETIISMPQLKSLDRWDISLKQNPDFQYFVSYDFYKIDNPHFHRPGYYGFNEVASDLEKTLTPQLNHITMKMPSSPLLQNRYFMKPEVFCNETTVKNCDKDFCECTHVIKVPLGTVVELILIDKGFAYDANHPFHLHGTPFRVVGMERLGSNVTVAEIVNLERKGLLKRNLKNPPIKDTVTTPDGGYTIIRFLVDNPGFWLFHCHIEFHSEIGMSLVFQFGETYEMPPIPLDFPQCGNYFNPPVRPYNPPELLTTNGNHSWWYGIFGSSKGNWCESSVSIILTMVMFICAF